MKMHEDQLSITTDVVRDLVSDQFPEWATMPVRPVPLVGTVNAIFRLGDGLAARFPLQPGDVEETRQRLRSEADAALQLRDHTSFAVPEPIAIGEPGAGYPLPWSVQSWLPGATASEDDVSNSALFARDLAKFIEEVRAIDLRGRTFTGRGRGGDLPSHDEWMETCFHQSVQLVDVGRLRPIWQRLRTLPRENDDVMTHGDLIPGNVLVSGGRLAGVLDVGGLEDEPKR